MSSCWLLNCPCQGGCPSPCRSSSPTAGHEARGSYSVVYTLTELLTTRGCAESIRFPHLPAFFFTAWFREFTSPDWQVILAPALTLSGTQLDPSSLAIPFLEKKAKVLSQHVHEECGWVQSSTQHGFLSHRGKPRKSGSCLIPRKSSRMVWSHTNCSKFKKKVDYGRFLPLFMFSFKKQPRNIKSNSSLCSFSALAHCLPEPEVLV